MKKIYKLLLSGLLLSANAAQAQQFLVTKHRGTTDIEHLDVYPLEDVKQLQVDNPNTLLTVYQALQSDGRFSTYLRLLADEDCQDMLQVQSALKDLYGRKMVVAATDQAWATFFKNNAALPATNSWSTATSYEKLTAAQKRLLLHTSIQDVKAYEWYYGRTVDYTQVLRVESWNQPLDNVSYQTSGQDGKGFFLASDNTSKPHTVWTEEYLDRNGVTDADYRIILGHTLNGSTEMDGVKLEGKATECANGTLQGTSLPIVPLPNMADIIHTNGHTDIFAHIMDRFSTLECDKQLTAEWKAMNPSFGDSILVRKYPSLKIDPAWNGYYDSPCQLHWDMAAMYVPNDDALWTYFIRGGGRALIECYCSQMGTGETTPYVEPKTKEELYQQIDQISPYALQGMVSMLMQYSFRASVPSKMTLLRNDALQQFFYPEDRQKIERCIMGCNGAVYIMKDVYGPTDFISVAAPAYCCPSNSIMKWAIYNGSGDLSRNPDVLGLNYYAYLKAMQADLTFFLPTNEALKYYYDVASAANPRTPRCMEFSERSGSPAVQAKAFQFNFNTGEKGDVYPGQYGMVDNSEMYNRISEILKSHTIVHDANNPIDGENEYFLARDGSPIKVVRDANGRIVKAMGGFQLENQRRGVSSTQNPGLDGCNVTLTYDALKNGRTLELDAPLLPTWRSVYSILDGNGADAEAENPYYQFQKLCSWDLDAEIDVEEIIRGCGLVDSKLNTSEQRILLKKYRFYCQDNGLDYNVQFLNNYHYTAFIPTNDAVLQAIANGLPTWESIARDFMAHWKTYWNDRAGELDYAGGLVSTEDSLRIQAKVTYLTNFLRYHFVDNSVFADKGEMAEKRMETSSYDRQTGLFGKVYVERLKQGGETILRVRDSHVDEQGTLVKGEPLPTVGTKNVLARDITCSGNPVSGTMNRITVVKASPVVIHQINGVLNHCTLQGGRHDAAWKNMERSRNYIKRYGIK